MKLFQVDSFTNERFKGNPAGVCIVDKFPETKIMQNVALEMNLSETAFIEKNKDSYNIRYFTPTMEVPLCGHATLACAHIIKELGIESSEFTFRAKETELHISFSESWIKMIFPKYPIREIAIPPELNEILNVDVKEVYTSNNNWTVVLVNSEQEVLKAKPKFDKLRNGKYGGLIALTSRSDNSEFDFVTRIFCDPDCGITEDPVTGSANCILVPFWNLKTNKIEFKSKQLSARTGIMKTELIKDKVIVKGQAVTVMAIELLE